MKILSLIAEADGVFGNMFGDRNSKTGQGAMIECAYVSFGTIHNKLQKFAHIKLTENAHLRNFSKKNCTFIPKNFKFKFF